MIGAHEAVLDCADLSSVFFKADDIQDFDTDGTRLHYLQVKFPTKVFLDSFFRRCE